MTSSQAQHDAARKAARVSADNRRLRGAAALSATQRRALLRLSPHDWRGALEAGVQGNTLEALEQRGLARVAKTKRPYRRLVGRLTVAGAKLARDARLDALADGLRGPDGWASVKVDDLVALWIADRITRADLDGELSRRAWITNAEDREQMLDAAVLDLLENLGPDGAGFDDLVGLVGQSGFDDLTRAELQGSLGRLGERIRLARSSGIYTAAMYPTTPGGHA